MATRRSVSPGICLAMPWASTARIGSRARHSSKRIAIWDLENAPAIRASIDALKAAGGMTVDNLKGALELVGKLSSYCRSGGLKPLEDLIDSGISRLIADLVSRVDSRTPQEARDIVGLITSARSKAGSGDAKRLAVLEDLAAQSEKASQQILSTRSSTAILKALDTYANQNTNERFQELREAFDGAKGMVFAEPAHVATIAQGRAGDYAALPLNHPRVQHRRQ